MPKTFIQAINDVGKNTRLSTGSTWSALDTDADQTFIQQMLNEAKRMVEAERQWNVLKAQVTFDSVGATQTYDLSDAGVVTAGALTNERSQLVDALNGFPEFYETTSGDEQQMTRITRANADRRQLLDVNAAAVQNNTFAIYQTGAGLTVKFPFDVDGVRTYSVNIYTPQADLAATTTEITAPWRPIILAATALVADERGEELGLATSTWWDLYRSALSDAIVSDMWVGAESVLVPV